ncbi:hypothetical protein N0V82_004350 [Gnomoniopsis sp. IMI 355080]|nr:hypothetical protein N0V82_004350 [Gnomoniopsis sp. IMI 355080]
MSSISSSRPLGNLELFFKKLADSGSPLGREHWAVHLALTLRIKDHADLLPYLQNTWLAIRREHPAIGSIIKPPAEVPEAKEHANDPTREVLTIPALDAVRWGRETFFVHENEKDADGLFSGLQPTPTATCHWLPQSSTLIIRSSHWRLDGIGIIKLGHVFLTTLAETLQMKAEDFQTIESTKERSSITTLPPNLERLAQIWRQTQGLAAASSQNERQVLTDRLDAGADALVGEFLRGVPSIGLPNLPDTATTLPGASARVETKLDISMTAKITKARRAMNLSFTGAVHAAIVRVTARYPQHPLAKSYAAFFPVDLRQSILAAGAASEEELMFGLYFSGLPVCINGMIPEDDGSGETKGFKEIAREMTAVYSRDLTAFWNAPDGHQVSLMELAEPYLKKTTVLFNTPVPEGLPLTQTPDLSGLGKVETFLQREYQSTSEHHAPKVEVADVWVGTEIINRCVQFHVWSWRDEFRLGVSFNKSFYEKTFVANLLDQVVEELLTGLDVHRYS